ncbi:hypothetical protein L3X38_004681 [Prunus dulcis]|uniref:Uncharacterized protein n=1 Tax=Prunus dulcis TaxID=3755 RepID=A0AAD4ZPD1_PRUDU|nr:hypothetical protein L3X38_004681 [Prunus dulcis]
MVGKNIQIKFQLIRDDIKVVRILRYLKSVPGKGMMFLKHGHVKVVGYIDSDWAGKGDKRRSASSYFTFEEIVENPVQHDRTKHVEIDRNSIYEKLEEKIIEVLYVKTTEQLVDMLTKAISNQAFTDSLVNLGICDIDAPS